MTEKADVLAGLAEIFEDVVGATPDNFTSEKSLEDDLEVDSLSMVEIAVQVEDKFGVKIQDDDLTNLKTVGDTVEYVLAHQ
jgi:acyl carrier protein